ncbi:hypothetical protein H1P_3910001 [Hyella patelloides LEGE 07179]|uniref:Uncharacterized protein n=1 Tax=Hyella patelloides LEGE 07179 TaxID=945734 RepID=A0A563VX32_9CYAN|nr:hypothetical protein H1P_3910001 [Hyella patelloides LEGE 07179]
MEGLKSNKEGGKRTSFQEVRKLYETYSVSHGGGLKPKGNEEAFSRMKYQKLGMSKEFF